MRGDELPADEPKNHSMTQRQEPSGTGIPSVKANRKQAWGQWEDNELKPPGMELILGLFLAILGN